MISADQKRFIIADEKQKVLSIIATYHKEAVF